MDVQEEVQTTTAGTDLDDALIDSIINGGSDLLNQGINLGGDTMHKVTEKLSIRKIGFSAFIKCCYFSW